MAIRVFGGFTLPKPLLAPILTTDMEPNIAPEQLIPERPPELIETTL
jgi:hypothetical protein